MFRYNYPIKYFFLYELLSMRHFIHVNTLYMQSAKPGKEFIVYGGL